MNIYAECGDKVRYVGTDDYQVRWGGNDDPRKLLIEGEIYSVDYTDVHGSYTKVKLIGIDGLFNSVCFEDAQIFNSEDVRYCIDLIEDCADMLDSDEIEEFAENVILRIRQEVLGEEKDGGIIEVSNFGGEEKWEKTV